MVSKWGCVGWLKKRTNLEKTLLSLSSLLLLTLVVMILINAISHGKASGDSEERISCWTSECIQTAGEILSSVNPEIDSCSDFYSFSCGRFGLQQSSSADKKATDAVFFALKNVLESSEELEVPGLKGLRSFYDSCVEFGSYLPNVDSQVQSFLALMSEMGLRVWPVLDPTYETSDYDTPGTLASLTLLGVSVVFRMEVVQDTLLPDSYLLKISPGGPHESGRSPNDIRSDVRLHSGVLTSLLLLGVTSASAATDVRDILNVERSFALIDKETNCDGVDLLPPSKAMNELQRLVPQVEWTTVFSTIRKTTGLHHNFGVELHCKRKIRDYANHLSDMVTRTESNYLGWRFFAEFLEHVIPTFAKSSFGKTEEDVGPRWRSCLDLMQKFATPLLTEVFTRKMIGEKVQSEVERIVRSVKVSTQEVLSRAWWLSEPQRQRVRQKVARLPVHYPFLENGQSKRMPVSIPQVDKSNFTSVVVHLHRQWVIQSFKRLDFENFTESWVPLLSSKGNNLPSDYIPVYLDKVVPPYLRFQGTDWINFGGFGVFLAREISRLLIAMNAGSSPDESELVWNLWTRNNDPSSCFVKSFVLDTSYTEELSPEMMETIMKERFLDLSSLEIAYESAKSSTAKTKSLPGLDFSREKMFFLSHAQTHCDISFPSEVFGNSTHIKNRFNSVVSNFGAFNKVYGCASSTSSQCPPVWQ